MAYINRENLIQLLARENSNIEAGRQYYGAIYQKVMNMPTADVVEVKQIEIIRDDLKWWLETNSEKGVVYIPKYVVENMIAKMDSQL